MPAGGEVSLQVEGTRIRVADTGAGIPADQLPRIFAPFFTTKEKGTGLGLAIVRSIVEKHGGRVRAESKGEGKGATFLIQLPRK